MAQTDLEARGTEEPLDPAAERLRRKLTWLLAGSFGVMLLGLIAVFGAIVYRLGAEPDAVAPVAAVPPEPVSIPVPPDARIVFTGIDGNRLLLRLALPDGATRLVVLDARTGAVLTQIDLRPGG